MLENLILKTHSYNVKQKQNKLRVYIESQDLKLSGFDSGKYYDAKNVDGKLILNLNIEGKRKVAIRKISVKRKENQTAPVLDLQSKINNCNTGDRGELLEGFVVGSKAQVSYLNNQIIISNIEGE